MGIEEQGSKPTGKIGIIIGRLMNLFHTGFYKKYYKKILPYDSIKILDLGCGGGRFLKYLSRKYPEYLLHGLDHSSEMIELSMKINKKAIHKGQVNITKGSVSELPFNKETMDIVTANETVQFWPDIEKSFSEIYKILIKGGRFFIINRYPPEGSKWWKAAKLKNEQDFESALHKAGFKQINIDLTTKKSWIIVKAEK